MKTYRAYLETPDGRIEQLGNVSGRGRHDASRRAIRKFYFLLQGCKLVVR